MAVLDTIRSFFVPAGITTEEVVTPAPLTTYSIRPLKLDQLKELLSLNLRCFTNGDSYNKHTLNYLLSESRTLGYRTVTSKDELVAFAFVMINANGAAHLTTIGVAPEHRRRGLAGMLLKHIENALCSKDVGTIMLEVRVSNLGAQTLYNRLGYSAVQRIANYYNNGEDCYLMMKSLV